MDITVTQILIHLTTSAPSGNQQTVLDVKVRGVGCNVQKTFQEESTNSSVNVDVSARQVVMSAAPKTVAKADISLNDVGGFVGADNTAVRLTVDGLRLGLLRDNKRTDVHGNVELFDFQFVTVAVGLALGMAQTWISAADKAKASIQKQAPSRMLLYCILKGAIARGTIADHPAFVYESAYGLHVEDQRNIRRNLGWMMLARLRHWLRLGITKLRADEISSEQIGDFIVSQMAKYDESVGGNEDLVRQQEFVKLALGSDIEQLADPSKQGDAQSLALFANIGSLTLRHYDRLLETGEVAPSTTRVLCVSVGLQRSAAIRDKRPFGYLRVITAVNSVEVEIQSGAVSAVQSLLTAVKDDLDKPPQPDQASSRPVRSGSLLILDGHVGTASISALASGLRLRSILTGPHVSLSQKNTLKGNTGDAYVSGQSSATICSDAIELSLLQPVDEHDLITHSEDRVVTSVKLDSLRLAADFLKSTKQSMSTTVRFLIGVKDLHFDSRPQLRAFYYFVHDWQERHYK